MAITDEYTDNIAFSEDGGQTWTLNPNHPVTKGFSFFFFEAFIKMA